MQKKQPCLAIIGAGLSGLMLARQLTPWATCELFEKSRGLGGRLATRYTNDYQFDKSPQIQPLLRLGYLVPLKTKGNGAHAPSAPPLYRTHFVVGTI